MSKKLTVQDVIDRLQRKVDRMEAKIEDEGLDLLVAEADEFLPKIEAYEEAIELMRRIYAPPPVGKKKKNGRPWNYALGCAPSSEDF